MRFFLELSYHGAAYGGWQRQPNSSSVQAAVEDTLSVILRRQALLTGCGRTDAGVHAQGYFAHLDLDQAPPPDLVYRLNRLLPDDIAVHALHPVHAEAHARFDAIQRRYRYRIILGKDPFLPRQAWWLPQAESPDLRKLNEAASLLLRYHDFAPFCKTGTDAHTRHCDLRESFWLRSPDGRELVYWVTSDRFLRGMIRLIVGMCLRVASGKTSLEEVKNALDNQTPLPGSDSVPPDGLTLMEVRYPYLSSALHTAH